MGGKTMENGKWRMENGSPSPMRGGVEGTPFSIFHFPFSLTDALLRSRNAVFADVAAGRDLRRWTVGMLSATVTLMASYGLLVGLYAGGRMVLYNVVKFPWLLLVTFALCLGVLYVCNSLIGARLGLLQTAALVLCTITVTATLLISLAPIAGFFMFTGGDNYQFVVLLNSAFFGLAGFCGWRFSLHAAQQVYQTQPNADALLKMFKAWLVVYGLVGMQMAWLLRPYFNDADIFLRPLGTEGNIFVSLTRLLWNVVRSALP